ncbi:MAG: methyltransferase [Polyangiaceae bacterium]
MNRHSLNRFADDTLFCRIARTVCEAECLPRKELYESWEFARRVRRRLRGGRIVDLAAGHGLVALILLVLDDSSENALAVDVRIPPSAHRLREVFERDWPRLRNRIIFHQASIDEIEVAATDLVVSAHACGTLTDRVLDLAMAVRANVAVLPCCQAEGKCDSGGLLGWMDSALAVDVTRAHRLRSDGYDVVTQTIPAAITPKNRLLIGIHRASVRSADSAPTGLEHQT